MECFSCIYKCDPVCNPACLLKSIKEENVGAIMSEKAVNKCLDDIDEDDELEEFDDYDDGEVDDDFYTDVFTPNGDKHFNTACDPFSEVKPIVKDPLKKSDFVLGVEACMKVYIAGLDDTVANRHGDSERDLAKKHLTGLFKHLIRNNDSTINKMNGEIRTLELKLNRIKVMQSDRINELSKEVGGDDTMWD